MRTVEASYDRLLVISFSNNDLDMRMCASIVFEMVVEEGTGVGGRGPFIAVFENELSALRNEGYVTI